MADGVMDHKPIPSGDSALSSQANEYIEQAAHPLPQRNDTIQSQGVFYCALFILNAESMGDVAKQCHSYISTVTYQ